MDNFEKAGLLLSKGKYRDKIARLVRILESTDEGGRISTKEIEKRLSCKSVELREIIKRTKKYFFLTKRKVVNDRAVGYGLANNVSEIQNEAMKEGYRGMGHLAIQSMTMSMVNKKQIKTADEMEVFMLNMAISKSFKAMEELRNEARLLLSDSNAIKRDSMAKLASKSPLDGDE